MKITIWFDVTATGSVWTIQSFSDWEGNGQTISHMEKPFEGSKRYKVSVQLPAPIEIIKPDCVLEKE